MKGLYLVALVGLAAPLLASGQVADRVADMEDGVVRFAYETRAAVEICDQGIRIGDNRVWWRSRGWDERPRNCRWGSVEVEVELRNGRVWDVDIVRSQDDRSRAAVVLGDVPADEAVAFFLSLTRTEATERAAKAAMLPAMLADVDEIWRELADIAGDPGIGGEVRKSALFWLGQEAADAVTSKLAGVALDEDEDQEIRDAAIFALSQRSPDEAIPVLMELARAGEQAKTRRTAMFWLAQSDDERVVSFFESVLLGRSRR